MVVAMVMAGEAAWAGGRPCAQERANLERVEISDPSPSRDRLLVIRRRDLAECEQKRSDRAAQEAEAQRKADAEQAEAARQRAVMDVIANKVESNPKLMAAIYGAGFCMIHAARAKVLTEIATQKKYARVGGAVNLRDMYTLQKELRRLDELEASDRAAWRSNYPKTALPPCSARAVKELLSCKTDDADVIGCNDPEVAVMVSLVTDPSETATDE